MITQCQQLYESFMKSYETTMLETLYKGYKKRLNSWIAPYRRICYPSRAAAAKLT